MDFPREELAAGVQALARQGIYVGTSSWKYQGWLGLIYSDERYRTRGRVSRAKFEKTCLAEYAKIFRTVCLDGGFYQFPTDRMMAGYMAQVPDDFRFSIKVTEDITVKRFPELPRYGKRAGQGNPSFLNAELFANSFLAPLERYRERIGTLIFEFSHLHKGDWKRGREFVEAVDAFLGRLPRGWDYSVEVRSRNLLQPEYFSMLRRRAVAHVFNCWSKMPSVSEQMGMDGSFTADFATARFLLKPGRTFEEAVNYFSPYREIREPNPEARAALLRLLTLPADPLHLKRRFLYVNNRLEGCSLWTIFAAITGILAKRVIVGENELHPATAPPHRAEPKNPAAPSH